MTHNTKHKNLVGIIVDHPSRDLPGLILIAERLLKNNYKVLLIPSYNIDFVLLSKKFHFKSIIFNYFREANYRKIIYAKSLGIQIIILDQESVGGYDGLSLVRNFKNPLLISWFKYIDYYLFPGEKVKKICLNALKKGLPKNNLNVGFSRFEILKKNFNNINDKNFILINTNFPGINPFFIKNDRKSIIKEIKRNTLGKINQKELNKFLVHKENQIKKFKSAIIKLIRTFKNEHFIIRPHPFENHRYWQDIEKMFPNCKQTKSTQYFL